MFFSEEISIKIAELEKRLLLRIHELQEVIERMHMDASKSSFRYHNMPEDESKLAEDSLLQMAKYVPYENGLEIHHNATLYRFKRQNEITEFNATLETTQSGSMFYYYWKIDNASIILQKRQHENIQSPDFYITGKLFLIMLSKNNAFCTLIFRSTFFHFTLSTPSGFKISRTIFKFGKQTHCET